MVERFIIDSMLRDITSKRRNQSVGQKYFYSTIKFLSFNALTLFDAIVIVSDKDGERGSCGSDRTSRAFGKLPFRQFMTEFSLSLSVERYSLI